MKRTAKWASAVFAAVVTVLLAAGSVNADLVAMHTARTTVGNQTWGGVGWTFDVTAPTVTVLELGIYDSEANGILGANALLTTVLFDAEQNVIASQTFTAANPVRSMPRAITGLSRSARSTWRSDNTPSSGMAGTPPIRSTTVMSAVLDLCSTAMS